MRSIAARVSPTVEGYSGEYKKMAKSAAEAERLESSELEKISRARELTEQEIIGQGTFLAARSEKQEAALKTIFFASGILMGFILYCFIILFFMAGAAVIFGVLEIAATLLVPAIIFFGAFLLLREGVSYRYAANPREFFYTPAKKPDGRTYHFFYKDVISVEYQPFNMLFWENGYYVYINTKSGLYVIKYNFPRFRHPVNPRDLPFELIAERIGGRIPPREGRYAANETAVKKFPNGEVRMPYEKKTKALFFSFCAVIAAVPFAAVILESLGFIHFGAAAHIYITTVSLAAVFFALRVMSKGRAYHYSLTDEHFILCRADSEKKAVFIPRENIKNVSVNKKTALITTNSASYKFKCKQKPTPFLLLADNKGADTNDRA